MASSCLLFWLVGLLLLFGSVAAAPVQGQVADKDDKVVPQETPIFSNGDFHGTWHWHAVGCRACKHSDVQQRRNTSGASFSVDVLEFGSIIFTATTAHPLRSMLDFWAKGSGLTSISLSVMDTATNVLSRDVRFTSAEAMKGAVNVLGNDDDGFIHLQIDLTALQPASSSPSSTAAPTCDGLQHFDRIVLADVSGMGFLLVLDGIKLISADLLSASAMPLMPVSSVVPVLGEDLLRLKSAKNRYLMKLRDGVDLAAVRAVCQELAGDATTPRRFAGQCLTSPDKLGSSGQLGWNLVSITVKTTKDLQAMRKALGGIVEYLEADLTAFSTIRTFNDAVLNGSGFDIPAQPYPVDVLVPPALRLLAETDPQPNSEQQFELRWTEPVPVVPDEGPIQVSQATFTDIRADAERVKAQLGEEDLTATFDAEVIAEVDASEEKEASWGLDRINQEGLPLDGRYSSGDYDGRGVHIYILDTGVRTSHIDFKGRAEDGATTVGGSTTDDNGHGTHVAGIAVGSRHGVAPGATLHPVKVLGADGNGAYSNIVSALQWVKDHKARNSISSAVVAMSFAGPRSAALNDAIDAVAKAGIVVVAAAGNNRGGDACTMSPCSAASAISVGATTESDKLASFSNIGMCLSVFAPGNFITSTSWKSDTADGVMSGTSMATPHAAGAAALYLQVKSALKAAAVARYFEATSPQLMLNMISSRLRAGAPKSSKAPASAPSPAPTSTPKPAPAPQTAPSKPSSSFPPIEAPALSTKLPASICSSCAWCQFCS